MTLMTSLTDFIAEWTEEDFKTYGEWVQRAKMLNESREIYNSMLAAQIESRMDLVWEKQILPQNVEEYIAVPN